LKIFLSLREKKFIKEKKLKKKEERHEQDSLMQVRVVSLRVVV